ncbi:MAG: 3'(2'),5'-bisphosphate nucleotidase CysQ [Acidimicrobiaceae bacterium]|jgi:3'(2'), 5'-bisphosphate nucleotidase|nr:3'(2'),5'-bisphosphate nucleotidase CysQ [Acidimicrobiaceae bacterium]|tara:strand:+ start:75640 stop:76380 length:741 start_codon:yes stop_codon:yes gene_type:complete
MNDHELASYIAEKAGLELLKLRDAAIATGINSWVLRDKGDIFAHNLIMDELGAHRPDDAVLSEEGVDDRSRTRASRVWIVDPLDGSQDYPYRGSEEWAVHIALVEDGQIVAGAVACPSMDRLYSTATPFPKQRNISNPMLVVTNRWNSYQAAHVAEVMGARLASCGSAGVKASLVVGGEADVYIHNSGLYEWDVCAPVAVARAAGFVACQLDGTDFIFNKEAPVARGLVISHSELINDVLNILNTK